MVCGAKVENRKVVCKKCGYVSSIEAEEQRCLQQEAGDESKLHYHRTEEGKLSKCYHVCKNIITDYKFWMVTTLSFPLEHAIWDKVWPFTLITHFLGL